MQAVKSKIPLGMHLVSRAWASAACGGVTASGLPVLLDALREEEGKTRERGILTLSNHISVCDDPMLWSIMPWRTFLNPRTTRSVSGARDIMFTSPVLSSFFTAGQVVNTDRWGGIFQPAVKELAERLGRGDWIHVFPEGKCSQASLNPHYAEERLFRFKWGVAQMFLTSPIPPVVLPMHIAGFDKVMPEPRKLAFLPRTTPSGTLRVSIGNSLDSLLLPRWEEWRARVKEDAISDQGDGPEERRRRAEMAAVMRGAVQRLGFERGQEIGRKAKEEEEQQGKGKR